MIHSFLTLCFIITITFWFNLEFPKLKTRWQNQWGWIAAAVIFPLVGSLLDLSLGGKVGNFMLHAVGGGITSALIFKYLSNRLSIRLNWRLGLAALFMFTSALGVLNELAEFAAELLNLGIFTLDRQDTWRDFVANTSGAILAWLIIKPSSLTQKKR